MAITEFIQLAVKQDAETKEKFLADAVPFLNAQLDLAAGMISHRWGRAISVNGEDTRDGFHPVLGAEWEKAEDITAMTSTDSFKGLMGILKPLVTAPSGPQLYATEGSPNDVYAAPVTEFFRFKIEEDAAKEETVKKAWESFSAALGEAKVLTGISFNLPYREFLGIVGWESEETRAKTLEGSSVKELKEKLGEDGSFVATLAGL